MSVQIIQLSDIHLSKENSNFILDKIISISSIVGVKDINIDGVIILICGDLVQAGMKEEYDQLELCLASLEETIQKAYVDLPIKFIFIPGNHDCNFNKNKNICNALTESSLESQIKEDVLSCLLSRQEDFFNFSKNLAHPSFPALKDKIYWEDKFSFKYDEDKIFSIKFLNFNTSCLIKKDQEKGKLEYPISFSSPLESKKQENCLNVALMHHPLSWFETTRKNEIEDFLQRNAHVLITGHEHNGDIYNKLKKYSNILCMESHVFHDNSKEYEEKINSFYLDKIRNTDEEDEISIKNYVYKFENDRFIEIENTDSVVKLATLSSGYELDHSFSMWTKELDIKVLHPRKEKLYVDDIFVYPDLSIIDENILSKSNAKKSNINAKEIIDRKDDIKRYIIYGDSHSGKTMLAKVFFRELLNQSKKPIYLDCSAIKNADIVSYIDKAFNMQYASSLVDNYLSLDIDERAIILDNFEKLNLSSKIKASIILKIIEKTTNFYIFSNETSSVFYATNTDMLKVLSENFISCKIREYGAKQRSELITKWNNLNLSAIDEVKNEYRIIEVEKNIGSLLGKSLVPRYPLYITFFLQAMDSRESGNSQVEAYGGLYEIVIRYQLAKVINNKFPLQTLSNYLGELAYYIHRKDIDSMIDKALIREFHCYYNKKYANDFEVAQILPLLIESEILKEINCGNDISYCFQFDYIYYYFIAKYISDNISKDASVKEEIKILCGKFNHERYVNIWQFLTHVTNDQFIVDTIIEHAKSIFSTIEPIKFESDIIFAEKLRITDDKLCVVERPYKDQKEERLRLENEEEEIIYNTSESDCEEIKEVQSSMQEFTMAIKTIDILGQLLRNFTGTLGANDKINLLKETYNLGLRTIEFVLSMFRDNAENIVNYFADEISKKFNIPKDEIQNKVSHLFYHVVSIHSFSTLYRVALAVGSDQLLRPYSMVKEQINTTKSLLVLDAFVKLNATKNIETFLSRNDKNIIFQSPFCCNLIRRIVFDFFYMYPVKSSLKQSICKKYEIDYKSVTISDAKKIGSALKRVDEPREKETK